MQYGQNWRKLWYLNSYVGALGPISRKTEYLSKRVKKALTYPAIVFIIAMLVASIMLTKVIPSFAEAYSDLTLIYRILLNLLSVCLKPSINYGAIYLLVLFCFISLLMQWSKRSRRQNDLIHKNVLKLPFVGNILLRVILGRFTHMLATTINAGVPILDALKARHLLWITCISNNPLIV